MRDYTYTLDDGSLVACVDLGDRRSSAPELGLGPMPARDLHEAIDLLCWPLLQMDVGDVWPEDGWTLTRVASGWRVEARGTRPLLVTAPTLSDALAACRNARDRARRARLDRGYPVAADVTYRVAEAVGCLVVVTMMILPFYL